MSERRITLQTAAFLDSPASLRLDAPDSAGITTICHNFLQACYEDLGSAPERLDGEQLGELLVQALPRHFGAGDPLGPHCVPVIAAFLEHLDETAVVTHRFELGQALEKHGDTLSERIRSGAAHQDGVARTGKPKPVVHRAAKTGRNDPCPCGSGKKFKKCCMQLGQG